MLFILNVYFVLSENLVNDMIEYLKKKNIKVGSTGKKNKSLPFY